MAQEKEAAQPERVEEKEAMSILILCVLIAFIVVMACLRMSSHSELRASTMFKNQRRNSWRKMARANGRFLV